MKSLLLFKFLFLIWVPMVFPCTLVGVANEQEVIIGKNRDREADFIQSLLRVKPLSGYQYLGLKRIDSSNIVSGINEKGLVVVMAKPYTIKVKGVGEILAKGASVDEVIKMAQKGEIKSPMILLAADKNALLALEYYDREHFDFKKLTNGAITKTNHYTSEFLKTVAHLKPSKSSILRLQRAKEILEGIKHYDFNGIEKVLSDNSYGNSTLSIARFANKEKEGRTISSTIYSLRKDGTFAIKVLFGNPLVNSYLNISFNDRIPKSLEDGTFDRINKRLFEYYRKGLLSLGQTKEFSRDIGQIVLKLKPSLEKQVGDTIMNILEERDIFKLSSILSQIKQEMGLNLSPFGGKK